MTRGLTAWNWKTKQMLPFASDKNFPARGNSCGACNSNRQGRGRLANRPSRCHRFGSTPSVRRGTRATTRVAPTVVFYVLPDGVYIYAYMVILLMGRWT
jgi:hypothetical protein